MLDFILRTAITQRPTRRPLLRGSAQCRGKHGYKMQSEVVKAVRERSEQSARVAQWKGFTEEVTLKQENDFSRQREERAFSLEGALPVTFYLWSRGGGLSPSWGRVWGWVD